MSTTTTILSDETFTEGPATTTTILSDETFTEGPATKHVVTFVVPATTMRTFFSENPGLALLMYVFPFVLIWIGHRHLTIPRTPSAVAALATILLLAIGLGADSPAVVNPLVASMPLFVFAAYVAFTKLSSERPKGW